MIDDTTAQTIIHSITLKNGYTIAVVQNDDMRNAIRVTGPNGWYMEFDHIRHVPWARATLAAQP